MAQTKATTTRRSYALGAFVDARLDELGMSRTQLAELTGLARSTVHKLCTEKPPESVTPSQLRRLADAIGVSTETLLRLWDAEVIEAADAHVDDSVGAAMRRFALTNADVPPEVLADAIAIAQAAVDIHRRKGGAQSNA